jgi:hypothetical protein
MVGAEVRQLVAVRCRFAIQPAAGGVVFLCLLCYSWSHAADILLSPHGAGVLRDPASAPVVTLLHFGGNHRPLLRDVRRRAAIDPPLPVVPRTALGREGDEPDRHLLLPAPSQGTSHLCCGG